MIEKRQRWRATPEVRQAARELRKAMTPTERSLWSALRHSRLDGIRVRRQHAIDRFVLDFYIPSHRLAIELDGPVHDAQQERDDERTRLLALRGIRVIRFRNQEVDANITAVLDAIRAELQTQSSPLGAGDP